MMNMLDENPESFPDGDEQDNVIFHYRKGSFRRREDQKYSDLATGQNQPKRGLFRVLFQTKGNRIMFLVMVLAFALVFILNMIYRNSNEKSADGIRFTLNSMSFDGQIYATVDMKLKGNGAKKDLNYFDLFRKQKPEEVPEVTLSEYKIVKLEWKLIDGDGTAVYQEDTTSIFNGHPETVRINSIDHNIKKVSCHITVGGETLDITSYPKRN